MNTTEHAQITLPAFFKHSDIITQSADRADNIMTPYEVCMSVAKSVSIDDIERAQKVGNIWRVYLKNTGARIRLLAQGCTLRNKRVQLDD